MRFLIAGNLFRASSFEHGIQSALYLVERNTFLMQLIPVVRKIGIVLSVFAGITALASEARAQTATFDDMPGAIINSGTGILYANGGANTVYEGVTWDDRLSVFGDQYKVGGGPTDPYYGVPHSGNYALTNAAGTDGILITTDKILTSAWFGQNEFYGFGAGADQVTISALSGSTVLSSLVFNLPDNNPGLPEPLSLFDTSSFLSLGGVTGYRIDRNALGSFGGNWVADDFTFTPATVVVPEPGTAALVLPVLGMVGAVGFTLRRRKK